MKTGLYIALLLASLPLCAEDAAAAKTTRRAVSAGNYAPVAGKTASAEISAPASRKIEREKLPAAVECRAEAGLTAESSRQSVDLDVAECAKPESGKHEISADINQAGTESAPATMFVEAEAALVSAQMPSLSSRGAESAPVAARARSRFSKFDLLGNFPWGTVLWDMKNEGRKLEQEGKFEEADLLFRQTLDMYAKSRKKTLSKEDIQRMIYLRSY